MLEYVFNIGGYVLNHTGNLSNKEWMMISAVAVVLGIFFTRGFASKGRI